MCVHLLQAKSNMLQALSNAVHEYKRKRKPSSADNQINIISAKQNYCSIIHTIININNQCSIVSIIRHSANNIYHMVQLSCGLNESEAQDEKPFY